MCLLYRLSKKPTIDVPFSAFSFSYKGTPQPIFPFLNLNSFACSTDAMHVYEGEELITKIMPTF